MTYSYFYGSDSPFSNTYFATFKWRGMTFNSSEQFYTYRKAIYFQDVDTAQRIMNTTSPLDQQLLGRNVRNYNCKEWKKVVLNIMKQAQMLKVRLFFVLFLFRVMSSKVDSCCCCCCCCSIEFFFFFLRSLRRTSASRNY